jgi:Raf kinase inhibitor-like YbhB/YbcL family protein
MIPKKYSRKGDDISPPLEWGEPPDGTISFALMIYSDPLKDGGGNWVQWILYNIPSEIRSLPEALPAGENGILPDGSQHFINSWGEPKYGGPNPQHVQTFKYYFVLYALDTTLDLDVVEKRMEEEGTLPWIGSSKAVLEEAVNGHVLGLGELVAKYKEELE